MVRLTAVCLISAAAWAQTAVTITAQSASPGITIPTSFVGLSFEADSLTSATGFPATNPVFQQMTSQIAPAVIRFGGNSVDQLTGWMRGQRTSSTPTSILMSSDVDPIFPFARTVRWKILFSLNLGMGTPSSDADEAAYVYQNGSDVLLGLEIGNEPDLYHSNGLRPSTYTVSDYIAEWQTFANAVQAETPSAVLTAPAAAGSITTWTATVAQTIGSRLALLTQHLYPLAPTSANPNASNAASIPNLLDAATRGTENTDGSELDGIAQGAKIPWRMSETNSCYDGGEAGVSDVLASALWGVDYMFTLAGQGSTGVNFHGGGTGTYTPIAISGSSITARPLYYALLLFRAAARGQLVPLTVSANGVNLTAYGALDTDGTLRVIVINKDQTQAAAVKISPGTGYTTALAMTLAAPALDSTTGVILGNAAVAADGTWLPSQLTPVTSTGGSFSATVASGSAVLFSFGNGNLAIANAASGQTTISPNGLASAYGQALGMVPASISTPAPVASLAGVSGTIVDASGATEPVTITYAGPSQVNFLVPAGTATGEATVHFGSLSSTVNVANVSPGLFALGATRTAAAVAVREPNGQTTETAVPVFDCSIGTCVPVTIPLDSASTVYVSLYGTGLRAGTTVTATVGGVPVTVDYAGAQNEFPGLDQVNLTIPASLKGAGVVNVVVSAGGVQSNAVQLAF